MRIDGGSQSRLAVRCIPDGVAVWTAHRGPRLLPAHVGHGTACDDPQHTVGYEGGERQGIRTAGRHPDSKKLVYAQFTGDSQSIRYPTSDRPARERRRFSIAGSVDANQQQVGSGCLVVQMDRVQSTAWAAMAPDNRHPIWAPEGCETDRSAVWEFDRAIHSTLPTIGSRVPPINHNVP